MLGELNWIFTAITDTIAWNTLPRGTPSISLVRPPSNYILMNGYTIDDELSVVACGARNIARSQKFLLEGLLFMLAKQKQFCCAETVLYGDSLRRKNLLAWIPNPNNKLSTRNCHCTPSMRPANRRRTMHLSHCCCSYRAVVVVT